MKRQTIIQLTLLAGLIVGSFIPSNAQKKGNNEWLVVELGGGLQNIQFAPKDGEHTVGVGATFAAKYLRHLNNQWSVSGGFGFANYSSKAEFNMLETTQEFDNENNRPYELRTEYINFVEKQKMFQIEIPVGATFRIENILSNNDLYLGMGLRFGIPVSSRYKLKSGQYKVSGYYPSLDVQFEDMEEHDFYTVEAEKQKGKTNIAGFNMSIYGEALLHKSLSKTMSAYAGPYFSYCPLNIAKPTDAPIVDTGRQYNSSLNSNQVDKAHLVTIGLKAAILLDFRKTFHISSSAKF